MSDRASNEPTECPTCGAAVLNADAHERWHKQQTDVIDGQIDKMLSKLATVVQQGRR